MSWPLEPLGGGEAGATRVIWPSDVIDRKTVIDAKMTSVGADVGACAAFSDADRAAWAAFYLAWRKVYCLNALGACTAPDSSIWGLGGQYDDLETWDSNVYAWQLKVAAAGCKSSAPVVAPPTPTGAQASDVGAVGEIVKWGAVGLGVYFLLTVVGKTGLPELWPPKRRRP